MSKQCCEIVYKGRFANRSMCSFSATRERGGKWYCGIHDPEAKAARDVKAQERFDAESKAWDEKKRRTRAGELGIKLAKTLTAYLGCTGSGWTRIANKAEMNEMVHQAQAVLDALEGR